MMFIISRASIASIEGCDVYKGSSMVDWEKFGVYQINVETLEDLLKLITKYENAIIIRPTIYKDSFGYDIIIYDDYME